MQMFTGLIGLSVSGLLGLGASACRKKLKEEHLVKQLVDVIDF